MANQLQTNKPNHAAALSAFIAGIEVGAAITVQNLLVFPLLGKQSGSHFVSLADALESDDVVITEVCEGGDVNVLWVDNRGKVPVLIFDGEELVGAKQNRIANTTIYVAPGSKIEIPVSCVEQGRWAYKSRRFAAGTVMPSSMRKSKAQRLTRNLRTTGNYDADQGAVWNDVKEYATRRSVSSPTSAMADVTARDSATIGDYVGAIPCAAGQIGIAAFVDGKLSTLDVLGNAEAYKKLHAKLVGAVAAEAIDAPEQHTGRTRAEVRRVLDRVSGAPFTETSPPGVGTDLRMVLDDHTVAALLVENAVVHLALFNDAA